MFLFTAAWGLGQQWLVIVALLNSIVSLVYYGRIVKAMFFDEPPKKDRLITPLGLGAALVFSSVALLVLLVAAPWVLALARLAAVSL